MADVMTTVTFNGASDDLINPGSDKARRRGCTCPRMDNGHGAGWNGGNGKSWASDEGVFVVVEGCPMHWHQINEEGGAS